MLGKSVLYKALLNLLGMLFCTVPVLLSIILYFPLWISSDSGRFISGFCVLLLALAAVPLFRLIKRSVSSVSAHTLWFILFAIFFVALDIVFICLAQNLLQRQNDFFF